MVHGAGHHHHSGGVGNLHFGRSNRSHHNCRRQQHQHVHNVASNNYHWPWIVWNWGGGYRSQPRATAWPQHNPQRQSRTLPEPSGSEVNICESWKPFIHTRAFVYFLTVIMFITLIIASGQNSYNKWMLNPGESRRVVLPGGKVLTRSVGIRHVNQRGTVAIYQTKGDCPPLSGPTANLQEYSKLILNPSDYEFDYYYLNPGSVIDATLTTSQGGANLILLRGESAFKSWTHNPYSPMQTAEVVVYTSPQQQAARIQYTVSSADSYYLVYDNVAWGQQTVGSASITVTLTTYDTSEMSTIPSSACSYDGTECTIASARCIVVQVEPLDSGGDDDANSSSDSIAAIEIRTQRRWGGIFAFCVVPIVLTFARVGGKSGNDVVEGDNTSNEATDYQAFPQPPPTVPSAPTQSPVPSAPPLSVDAGGGDDVLQGTVINDPFLDSGNIVPVAVPIHEATTA